MEEEEAQQVTMAGASDPHPWFMVVHEAAAAVGPRLGRAAVKPGRGEVATPGWLPATRKGCVPHLTPDLLARVPHLDALQLPLQDFYPDTAALRGFGKGVGAFVVDPDHSFFLTVREVTAHEEGTIAKEGVAVRTGGGRTVVGVAAYMDHVLALGPDAFASLAPEISCLSSRKQTQKAHELTLQWLDTCLQRLPRESGMRVLGVVGGGRHVDLRVRSAQETVKRNVDGFLLSGFGLGESFAERETLLAAIVKELPPHHLRMVAGVGAPLEVLQCVEQGVDLINSAYPTMATELGQALNFSFLGVSAAAAEGGVQIQVGRPYMEDALKVNVRERAYKLDPRPISLGCECYTCTHHSIGYIHHLLSTHEMLASVLLNIHNTHQYSLFFEAIRTHVRAGTLGELKRRLLDALKHGR